MKILAIRGRNLASLVDDFALEMDQPPLDRMGLFAITGATGAGKSTLLDAMCLALFDCTPRLVQGSGVLVGRAGEDEKVRVKDTDARGMLRRGAVEGFAEVEFLGRDGRRYRAKWSVHRARERLDGTIQLPEMSLVDVASGQRFGAKKSEVLKAIEEKLGLSFEQFRRSALLAQGEFAAFLRAKKDDRAELLERMTGTEVYSRMSIAAHKRKQQVDAALEKLARGVEAISLMSEEERRQQEEGLAREEAARAEAQAVQSRAEHAVRWYRTRAELAAREREAEAERERAGRALQDAEPRRLEWERVRAAEDLRAPVSALDEATAALAARDAELTTRRSEEAVAREVERGAEVARFEAESRRDAAVKAEEAARPELEAAEALDGEIQRAEEQARDAARTRDEALASEQRARAELSVLSDQEASARKRLEDIQAWRDKRGPVEPVAREWSRWETELQRYHQQARQEAAAQALLTRTRAEAEPLRLEAERREVARRETSEALRGAEEEAARAESALGAEADAARRLRREELGTRQEVLKELELARKEAREAAQALSEATREVDEARKEQATANAEAEAAKARRTGLDPALKEARRAFDRTRDALELSARRADLREGEPCPLCGAKEHPYAREDGPLAGLLEEGRGRVASLENELQEVTRTESAAIARAQGAEQRAARAGERGEAAARRSTPPRERWSLLRAKLTGALPPESVEAPEAEAWLAEALAEVRVHSERLRAEEELAEAQAREAKEARARREAARTGAEAAEKLWRQADEAWRKNVDAEALHLRDVEQAAHGREALLAALSAAFTGWPRWEKELSTDAAAFQARCVKAVKEWNAKDEELRQAEAEARGAAEKRGPVQATVELLHAQSTARAQAATEREEALARVRASRGALFAGRATAEVRAALRQEREALAQALESRREDAARAARAMAVALARTEAALAARDTASAARDRAEDSLGTRLSERGLSLETARGLLARGAAWCADEERALGQLRQAHDKSLLLVEERQRQRLEHESSARPPLSEEDAASALERATADTQARVDAAARLRARLAQDDDARRRHGEQARLLEEEQRKSGVWRTLSELIGSHDGKKFKVFAQSLTLDALLHHANAHLEQLAPRYHLMRVPGYDLDLQVVDRDMGDEVRAVSSLSGGESFLVSLALALGLASLSSETTQVETLFIDEGFGTLDPETLEVALATLDALQATGRQVGIISHVSGLAERIGVQVRVVKQGAGRSRLQVVGEAGLPGSRASASRRSLAMG
ncbi:AAA family ATPase [Cystobacter fuscus]|uniref:AAA family ATPase n=1 Tax=Cystobacter fuscus TaxID=43 RepID=UPI002B292266|nr:AAA family ATPase [Cystobacter fuscus]